MRPYNYRKPMTLIERLKNPRNKDGLIDYSELDYDRVAMNY